MSSPATQPATLSRIEPIRLRIGMVQWEVRSTEVAEAINELLRAPDHFLARKERLVHDTFMVTLGRVSLPSGACQRLLLRRNNYGKPAAKWRDCFRTAGPLRAFRSALAMERAGLPAARVLAAGIRRAWRVPQAGYLLVEEIPNAVTLAQLAQRPQGLSRGAIRSVVEEIVRLHDAGFMHGDLTINNVLLDDAGKPWFIDLERTRRLRSAVNWRLAIEDFHRFARHFRKFSPAGRVGALRLLKDYCVARGWKGREREFIQALEQRLRHKMEAD
jgi:tRNA A-37 threonylcarbamoyl transferase component Bud32